MASGHQASVVSGHPVAVASEYLASVVSEHPVAVASEYLASAASGYQAAVASGYQVAVASEYLASAASGYQVAVASEYLADAASGYQAALTSSGAVDGERQVSHHDAQRIHVADSCRQGAISHAPSRYDEVCLSLCLVSSHAYTNHIYASGGLGPTLASVC